MCSGYEVYNMARRRTDHTEQTPCCSICLGEMTCPVDTNCGHKFCAQCILTHWQHDRWPNPCRCPVCRRDVNLLMGADEWTTSENRELFSQVVDYNQRMASREFGLFSRMRDAPAILSHLWGDMGAHLPFRTKMYFLAVIIAVMVYLISPIDAVPEFFFGVFGLVDDVLAVVCVVIYLASEYRNYVVNIGQRQR